MPLTFNHLHDRITLTQQEMCMISQAISRDFSPRFFGSRVGRQSKQRFTPQELREISRLISRDYAPGKLGHQSRLVLLAVSPRRLHAYWHVAKRLLHDALQRIEPEQPMTLRIYTQADTRDPVASASSNKAEPAEWFDITVSPEQEQQDVLLPESGAMTTPVHYSAALGTTDSHRHFTPWVSSNTAAIPQAIPPTRRVEPLNGAAELVMYELNQAPSVAKTASSRGKDLTHE